MGIYTFKLRWKDLSAILSLAAAFALCLIGGQMETGAVPVSVSAPTEAEQTAYLQGLGWEVSGGPGVEQVALPEVFGPEYEGYLALQAEGGFDLAAYAGRTVIRYSYPIANYPTGEAGVLADLLVLDGEIVGGELRSSSLDGFMAPLTAREDSELS